MTEIKIHTTINAPIETVFDLSRSIDFHLKSAAKTKEKAIAGRTSGLINYGETVTWRGRHLGLFLRHTSKITTFERPVNFTDTMIEGHFTYFIHQHNFRATNEGVVMTDILKYKVPFSYLGHCIDKILIKNHLYNFLKTRNIAIKTEAEAICC